MKIASLIIGIVFTVLSGLGILICLILPGMNSHVSFQESMMVVIPLAGLFFVSLMVTIISAILALKARKNAVQKLPGQ